MTISTLILALFVAPGPEPIRGPVLLDFYADWCGPCRQMAPVIDDLARRDYPVRKIDVDEEQELAEQYEIENLPTFIVLDAQGKVLMREEGAMSGTELARWIDRARALSRDVRPASTETPTQADDPPTRPVSNSANSTRTNPRPWETVVRITVHDNGSLGFGSGTVIRSTPEESIILTCAHIFQMNGRKGQVPPSRFPLPVSVELFDGVLSGPGNQTVRPVGKPLRAEVIDYDFNRDVGLVRIRPGRVIPAARVVPEHWKPRERMRMYTVGCSHGQDATAWNTVITQPQVKGLGERPSYEAIQCLYSPKQGRSGGGLFTEDGYVAGVCNFAFHPRLSQGLYATPQSIYRILDRNELQVCYQPIESNPGTMLAGRSGAEDENSTYARAQSPDREAGAQGRLLAVEPITVPPPEIWGVETPTGGQTGSTRPVSSASNRNANASHQRWRPVSSSVGDTSSMIELPTGLEEIAPAVESGGTPARDALKPVIPVSPGGRFEAGGTDTLSPSGNSRRRWLPVQVGKPR